MCRRVLCCGLWGWWVVVREIDGGGEREAESRTPTWSTRHDTPKTGVYVPRGRGCGTCARAPWSARAGGASSPARPPPPVGVLGCVVWWCVGVSGSRWVDQDSGDICPTDAVLGSVSGGGLGGTCIAHTAHKPRGHKGGSIHPSPNYTTPLKTPPLTTDRQNLREHLHEVRGPADGQHPARAHDGELVAVLCVGVWGCGVGIVVLGLVGGRRVSLSGKDAPSASRRASGGARGRPPAARSRRPAAR